MGYHGRIWPQTFLRHGTFLTIVNYIMSVHVFSSMTSLIILHAWEIYFSTFFPAFLEVWMIITTWYLLCNKKLEVFFNQILWDIEPGFLCNIAPLFVVVQYYIVKLHILMLKTFKKIEEERIYFTNFEDQRSKDLGSTLRWPTFKYQAV